ncbi:tetratricopeptide repeat protein [Paenibacillus segetis]|nr:hypothetical protein [Paenibacillus segetis]
MKSAPVTENELKVLTEFIFVKGGVQMMFQHVFAEMNEMLDEISRHYPMAQGVQKQDLGHKWNLLKHMSDGIIEEWLCFEEKMGIMRQNWGSPEENQKLESQDLVMKNDAFIKGQGYYKLLMYPQAQGQFNQALEQFPDSFLTHTYMGMCHLHMGHLEDAVNHFHSVLKGAANNRLRAIIYNALGCIEANRGVRVKAKEYFTMAHHSDPSLPEPLANLEVCMHHSGKLQFGNQLTSLL